MIFHTCEDAGWIIFDFLNTLFESGKWLARRA